MARKYQRYTKELLADVVSRCLNFADVARALGKAPVGGTLTNIKLMCARFGIDTSHMTGKPTGANKKPPTIKKTSNPFVGVGDTQRSQDCSRQITLEND
jgi:hypothetical protein